LFPAGQAPGSPPLFITIVSACEDIKMNNAAVELTEKDDDNEINLTPMLDVVFIMLIFFIVTASFVRETGIDVNRPDGKSAPPPDNVGILIAIAENNDIWIERRLIDPRALRANIERLHAENPAGAVVIQADKASQNNTLVQVMDAARQAGVYDISIAADRS
jgi:biopolymer transport protein ExbD